VPIGGQIDPIHVLTTAVDNNVNPNTEEIRIAVSQLSRGKAMVLDGISNEMFSLIGKKFPDIPTC